MFRGAEKPLVGEAAQAEENLAGASWETHADARQIEAEHAVSALIRFVNEYPGSCCFALCQSHHFETVIGQVIQVESSSPTFHSYGLTSFQFVYHVSLCGLMECTVISDSSMIMRAVI